MINKNKFVKGIVRDVTHDVASSDSLFHGSNIRIASNEDSSITGISNIRGNELVVDRSIRVGFYVVGSIRVDKYSVIFSADASSNNLIEVYIEGSGLYSVWEGADLYDKDCRISGIGRYENEDVINVYFTDGISTIKKFNIAPDTPNGTVFARALATTNEEFEFLHPINFSNIDFVKYIGGSYLSGAVQYSYRLYKKYSVETPFSPLSEMIYLSSSINENDSRTLFGNDIKTQTGVGISGKIELDASAQEYDYVEIASIYYSSFGASPEIRILGSYKTTNDVVYFSDSGSDYAGSIGIEDLNFYYNLFSTKYIAQKVNKLFTANNTTYAFDVNVDMRAFRYRNNLGVYSSEIFSNGGAKMLSNVAPSNDWYEAELNLAGTPYVRTDYTNNGTIYTFDTIPLEFDCINPFNIKDEDSTAGVEEYKYDTAGNMGASGKHITLNFNETIYKIKDAGSADVTINSDNADWILGKKASFKRDEIYRFGVVFYDQLGRPSPVKWIADIRMPNALERDILAYSAGVGTYGKALNPLVTLDVAGTEAEGLDYIVVMAKREEYDKTILGQGLIAQNMIYNFGGSTYDKIHGIIPTTYDTVTGITVYKEVVDFISPELYVSNSNISYTANDYIKKIGKLTEAAATFALADMTTTWISSPADRTKEEIIYNDADYSGYITTKYGMGQVKMQKPIYTLAELDAQSGSEVYNTYDYNHWLDADDEGGSNYGTKGSCMVMSLSTIAGTYSGFEVPIVEYSRNIIPYGGYSYDNRLNTEYIQVSDLCAWNVPATVWRGDTYIGYFDYLRWIFTVDGDDNRKGNLGIAFPVESYVNLKLFSSPSYFKVEYNSDEKIYMRETAGSFLRNNANNTIYTQDYNLYDYNYLYNQQSDVKYYVEAKIDEPVIKEYPFKIAYSDTKINGEEIDSWIKFSENNYNEVETAYGEITGLGIFADKMIVTQETGTSIALIEPKVINQNSDGLTTLLGTGEVLDSFTYVSTTIGKQDDTDLVVSGDGMYWIDTLSKKVVRLNNDGIGSLSDNNGIKSLLVKLVSNVAGLEYIETFYDKDFNEVLFNVRRVNAPNIVDINYYPNNEAVIDYVDLDKYSLFKIGREIVISDTDGNKGIYKIMNISLSGIELLFLDYGGADFITDYSLLENTVGEIDILDYTQYPTEGTLVFNEKIQGFYYHSYVCGRYIDAGEYYYSCPILTVDIIPRLESFAQDLYRHNAINSTRMYDRDRVSSFDYIISTSTGFQSELHSLNLYSNSFEIDNEIDYYEECPAESIMADAVNNYSDQLCIVSETLADKDDTSTGGNELLFDTNASNRILSNTNIYNAYKTHQNWVMPSPRCTATRTYNAWDFGTIYSKYDRVTYNNLTYISTVDNNELNEPSGTTTHNAYWEFFEERERPRGRDIKVRVVMKNDYIMVINSVETTYNNLN